MIIYKKISIDLPLSLNIHTIKSTLQSHFNDQNIPCFNNYQTSIICNDKSATHIEVAKLGIPAVKTFHYESYPKTPPLPYPFILKRSEEHTSELQSRGHLVCRLLLEKTK